MPNTRQYLNNYLSKVTLIMNRRQRVMPASSNLHVPPTQDDERNRSYLIRRAALGMKPTQDEMDALVAYGLQQHRVNFPHLYQQVN